MFKQLYHRGADLGLYSLSARDLQKFRLLKLDRSLRVYDTLDDAVEAYRKGETDPKPVQQGGVLRPAYQT